MMTQRQILHGCSAKSFLTSWEKKAELPDCVEQNKITELAGIRIQQFVWSNTCRTTLYRVIAMRYTDS